MRRHTLSILGVAGLAALLVLNATPALAAGNANRGAALVAANGCTGCHGARFEGGVGPKLMGIEHRKTPAQIMNAIENPTAPMPKFPFDAAQIADIATYLASLDGGSASAGPTASFDPVQPKGHGTLTVRFPGTPPKHVVANPTMAMGSANMSGPKATLHATSDPHVWKGTLRFSMGGQYMIDITYDGKMLRVPLTVAGGM